MATEQLATALRAVHQIKLADDMRWLNVYISLRLGNSPDLRGIRWRRHKRSPELIQAVKRVRRLDDDELEVIGLQVDALYELLRPKVETARGQVQVKAIIKRDEADEDGDLDEDLESDDPTGEERDQATRIFYYAYLRLHSSKGDADRSRDRLLSVYIDRGMGRGGTGGYLAAALERKLITQDEILDAYHASRQELTKDAQDKAYSAFLDRVEAMIKPQVFTRPTDDDEPEHRLAPPGYQFRIELYGAQPTVWRRFRAPGSITFYDLHMIIQCCVGWEAFHLYRFELDWTTIADMMLGGGEISGDAKVADYLTETPTNFEYVYDFGDNWQHLITLEQILDIPVKMPFCVEGKRAWPTEDCGGLWAYQDWLTAKKRNRVPRALKERLGADFDPNAFSKREINADLADYWRTGRT